MAVNVSRLRLWFAAAAIALVVLVAGVYFYGRLRIRRALNEVPRNLGINIQQSTQGFTFSKSEGGRTLFTVHASRAVQYKASGKAELRDVNIIVYGRQANRFDQIYGADFEYDPQSGNISALGEVHIDLEGNAAGPINPDQAPPQELKNPIHLKTSGLVFNQKTGLAETKERIEFRVPQASGSALGATYDSKDATLTLHKQIQVHSGEPHEADLTASQAVITKGPNRAVLHAARLESPRGGFSARQFTVFFRDDNTVDHVVATGEVQASQAGRTTFRASAARADAWLTQHNLLRTATLAGGVEVSASGQENSHGSAGRVALAFSGRNQLDKVTASENVRLVQEPPPQSAGRSVELTASAVDFLVRNGRLLTQAITAGPAQITVLPQPGATGEAATRTVATAGSFDAHFQRNRLSALVGAPDARLVTSAPGQPDKVTTSRRVEATFNPAGGIATLTQDGDFHYFESAASGQREAWAEKAAYSSGSEALILSGSPRIVESGMTTTADRIQINRRTGDAAANGDVKTTYSAVKPQPGGALLASGDPIHVTGRSMVARRSAGIATYFAARLWQGANVIEAPVLDFQREPRRVEARGENGRRITTVFVEQDKNGRVTPVNVSAARLTYTDAQRQARFEGGVTIRGADTTITAGEVDVFLQQRGESGSESRGGSRPRLPESPSQLDRIVARKDVAIQQPNRRANGQTLVYTALEGKFTLTGGPPSIFDAERGKITGDSLTFFQRDDRVLVESNTSPTVTQTRVVK